MIVTSTTTDFTLDSTVGDVIRNPAFGDFGRLLFPVDIPVYEGESLKKISSSSTYLWYSDIRPAKTVEVVNDLKHRAERGEQIFYPIYTKEEIRRDPDLANTGLFYFRGRKGERFAIMNAGGGFYYVGAMHDSFPHAEEAAKRGYNAFALIYRPTHPYQDLGRAIRFIIAHARDLGVNPKGYSLWGGSAGARMAAALGNQQNLSFLAGDVPQAAAIIIQYTGYDEVSRYDAPTYACVGTSDGIASWQGMQQRLAQLERLGIPTEFHAYPGLYHGFGLGTGTIAEGWIDDAIAFWKKNADRH